uniref:Uncharacterized protein n=1 Tax=Glossina morsitans morsitans TaxID=37546 RepID=A0A1B0FG60_GLOMM
VLKDSEETLNDESLFISDCIAALNFELERTDKIAEDEGDNVVDLELLEQDGDSRHILKMKKQAQKIAHLKTLFKGLKFFINREVFDCVRQVLPTSKYFIGVVLPPHLSPFVEPNRDAYIPPEEILDPANIEVHEQSDEESPEIDVEPLNSELSQNLMDFQLEKAYQEDNAEKKNMSVESGKICKEDKRLLRKNKVDEHRLQVRMVKPRHRNLFRKLI